ncbi:hypothetical protein D9M68_753730 [compost metagenome]
MNDDALLAFQHLREQGAIEAHGRKQVQVELALPLFVVQRSEAAAGCRRTTQDVDDDIHAAQAPFGLGRQGFVTVPGREIRLHEQVIRQVDVRLSRRGQHLRALREEPADHCTADAFGAAGD